MSRPPGSRVAVPWCAALVLVWMVLASPAPLAHGGGIQMPQPPEPDSVAPPPGAGKGGIYLAPGDAGSGASPPPARAVAPGPGGARRAAVRGLSSSAPGSARSAGVRGQSSRAVVTGSSSAPVISMDTWEYWWEANQDRFLELKSRVFRSANVSGSPGQLTGRGRKRADDGGGRPTPFRVGSSVVPRLIELLHTSDESEVLDASLIALGRTCMPRASAPAIEITVEHLGHPVSSVSSAAALSLGLLDVPATCKPLLHLARNDSEGRRLVGGGAVPWLVRSHAVLALGLLGDGCATRPLLDMVGQLSDADRDVKSCTYIALGHLGRLPDWRDQVLAQLLSDLDDAHLDPAIACFVPTALARTARGSPAEAAVRRRLDDTLRHRNTDALVRQSCALALGGLGTLRDGEVVETLVEVVEEERDVQTRHFALMALGEMGAATPAEARDEHLTLDTFLMREMTRSPKSHAHRSWAALAAAVHARPRPEAHPALLERLRASYDREDDPAFKGAFAIALGMLEDVNSGPVLLADMDEVHSENFRGHAAVALGLMRHREAIDELLHLATANGTADWLRVQASTGLALLGEADLVPVLVETLATTRVQAVTVGMSRALGLLGHRDALPALVELVGRDDIDPLVQAFSVVALGLLAERGELPWHTALRARENYTVGLPALAAVQDIL